ncbi:WD40 repeat-like protein [Guyanagaster necrorhizus]|uniref:WD40 repeat-like protein n=1 Tax=Guyanagaster necrorhizus TaxID=856835 RepID=A0A9P8AM40_9AGAR|nr:WD40 repeat-like protein [Guyanagaster necrorhizus MCA 3950]KAG7440883.1 WD40 repeat-like protein [Guyanagaster necrorhizus MCA 3950]
MAQTRRRVSYVILPPDGSVPRLQLPPHGVSRLGCTGPLLRQASGHGQDQVIPKRGRHPRHRLGVASLALDTSTQLTGRGSPEGVLYSGGRDGMVISWDLGMSMKKRKLKQDVGDFRRGFGRWELMTGWGDDIIAEEAEDADDRPTSDGDVLGDVTAFSSRRRRQSQSSLPYEQQWETDLDLFKPGQPSHFRQSAQLHMDWINDIALCNHNQTVVSASSDGTIKAWNPHSPTDSEPSRIGVHSDYVRCLTHCREQNWVASGSFDRTIKLWDLGRSNSDPLITLNPAAAAAPKSSVYAIAVDPYGHSIASGSPERVVRLWDPRSGKRTGKLVGHTDNIRAILISEDSRYLLTGSADASVKLWSLTSQKCLHTFTHHTESVWSLFSSHPTLEIFYSGDRSGLVCKVDVEDCSDVAEGECIVLYQDHGEQGMPSSEGINSIVAMDDNLLWTATGNSSIHRWRVPQRRSIRANALLVDVEHDRHDSSPVAAVRRQRRQNSTEESVDTVGPAPPPRNSITPSIQSLSSDNWLPQRDREDETTLYGIPFVSLVKLVSASDPFTYSSSTRGRDPEVATLYSAASVMSVPRASLPIHSVLRAHTSPIRTSKTGDTVQPVPTARAKYDEREIATDAVPLYNTPDNVIQGDHGLVRCIILNDRLHALTVDTSGEVAVWDVVRCFCRGKFRREDVAAISHQGSSVAGSSGGEKERSPREVLDSVRERIEGEGVALPWATADTKAGVLVINMDEKCFEAEVYADEVGFVHDRHFNDESKLNIGKWVLRNLFLGFIREEQRMRRHRDRRGSEDSHQSTSPDHHRRSTRPSATVISSPHMIPAVSPTISSTYSSPLLSPLIPLHPIGKENSIAPSVIPQSPALGNDDITPTPRILMHQRLRSTTIDSSMPTGSSMPKEGDYFSVRRQISSQTSDELSGDPVSQIPSPGGFIGLFKNLGKSKRPVSDVGPSTTPIPSVVAATIETQTPSPEQKSLGELVVEVVKTPLQKLLSGTWSPPSSTEAPPHSLPSNLIILISEEGSPNYNVVYHSTAASTAHDTQVLEEAMPMWLIEYLLLNKAPAPVQVKISFVLLPYPSKGPDTEPLPELINTAQSKLTANRFLRVRKLIIHVQEKLDKITSNSNSRAASIRSSVESTGHHERTRSPRPRAEDLYEILCNDILLPLDMSLAAVRYYVWKQSAELTMHYRRKLS